MKFSLVLLSLASLAISEAPNDNRNYLYPDTLKGLWIRTKDFQDQSNPEWFRRIKYVYRIGVDTLPEYNYPTHTKLMTFSVVYPATDITPSSSTLGYFCDWEPRGDYDPGNDITYLVCKYIPNNQDTSISLVIKFAMPSTDSLTVILEDTSNPTESFGLKRSTF